MKSKKNKQKSRLRKKRERRKENELKRERQDGLHHTNAKRKLTDKQYQTEFLYQHGLSAGKITTIIDIARSTADKIILEYRASHYGDKRKVMGITDALALMRAE